MRELLTECARFLSSLTGDSAGSRQVAYMVTMTVPHCAVLYTHNSDFILYDECLCSMLAA